MPIEITAQQEALLRLPEPDAFTQRIANELREHSPQDVAQLSDTQLLDAVRASYAFATHELHITRIRTLVHWVKLDATSDGALRKEPGLVLKVRAASNPNLAAQDLISIAIAQTNWGD